MVLLILPNLKSTLIISLLVNEKIRKNKHSQPLFSHSPISNYREDFKRTRGVNNTQLKN